MLEIAIIKLIKQSYELKVLYELSSDHYTILLTLGNEHEQDVVEININDWQKFKTETKNRPHDNKRGRTGDSDSFTRRQYENSTAQLHNNQDRKICKRKNSTTNRTTYKGQKKSKGDILSSWTHKTRSD